MNETLRDLIEKNREKQTAQVADYFGVDINLLKSTVEIFNSTFDEINIVNSDPLKGEVIWSGLVAGVVTEIDNQKPVTGLADFAKTIARNFSKGVEKGMGTDRMGAEMTQLIHQTRERAVVTKDISILGESMGLSYSGFLHTPEQAIRFRALCQDKLSHLRDANTQGNAQTPRLEQ